jgi:hypothetical protein
MRRIKPAALPGNQRKDSSAIVYLQFIYAQSSTIVLGDTRGQTLQYVGHDNAWRTAS